jgi:ribosome-associated toxin RatA of RatAB toxin-antitoxin module
MAFLFLVVGTLGQNAWAGGQGGMTALGQWIENPAGLPPEIPLTPGEEKKVFSGEPIFKQANQAIDGFGVTVFEVNAPPPVIMKILWDIGSYKERIPQIDGVKIYGHSQKTIFAAFKMVHFGWSIDYFVRHELRAPNVLVWDLDPKKDSDIAGTRGFWRIRPHPKKPDQSLVEYAGLIAAPGGWVPGFLIRIIKDRALPDGSQWVIPIAEKQARLEREMRLAGASQKKVPNDKEPNQ